MHHPYIDEYSGIDSLLHRLEPRVKIIGFTALLFFINLSRPDSFLAFSLYVLVIAVFIFLSKIPLKFILKRSMVVIPFVLMISLFIPFVKANGLLLLRNILLKAYLSILCMVLLVNTVKFRDLLGALEKLRFPGIIILILSFMYRYVFVIQDELMKMRQAKECRTVSRSNWRDFKAYAFMLGVLFIRSFERAEAVYLAMCSRGFNASNKR